MAKKAGDVSKLFLEKYTIVGVCRLVLPLLQGLSKRASGYAAGK